MPDLTLQQLKQAYDAALEQIASESFLEDVISRNDFINRLKRGNNPEAADPNAPTLTGKLRMTQSQAEAFVDRYQIIGQQPDDASGFSAVALRDTKGDDDPTNDEVIIAVRSTEFNLDRPRDVATDLQIEQTGFAFDQILALQAFKDLVLSQNPEITSFSLVGYSLSGNVVRTLAAMYPDEVNQAAGSNIVFNATGMGNFIDPTGQNRPRDVVLREMMTLYRTVEEDPTSADQSTIAANVNLQALYDDALAAPPLDLADPEGNIYTNARVAFAQTYIATVYGTSYDEFFDQTAAEPAFTQYYGHALSGFDTQAVANSGIHPDPIGIPIEGQPVLENLFDHKFDFLNTHSLTLMTDSLRLMILFKEVDPNITTDTIEAIFQASSNAKAKLVALAGDPNAAEGDTLEKALDALRAVFLGPGITKTPSDAHAGAFGDIDKRTTYYNNITDVEAAVGGQTFAIVPLTPFNAATIANAAERTDAEDPNAIAYRYALRELNPFAIIGGAPEQTDALYQPHRAAGGLDLVDPSDGTRLLTHEYLVDRAEKGTGYFVWGVRGRPRDRSVDSRPKAVASCSTHPGAPKGACRVTQVRRAASSCSKSGASSHWGQLGGSCTGPGSINAECWRLDHGHSEVCVTSPARTGLRRT